MQREAVRESLPPRASSATSARHQRRLRPLWQQLLWLAIVAMVPLAVIAGAGVARLLAQQRDQAERASLDFTRAFANAIEGDLQRSIAVLSVVAAAPLLDASEAAAQRDLLRRVLATLPDWRALILSDAAGRIVAHTGFPAGQEPPLAERESFQRAADERRPVVGALARGPGGQWAAPIRYPVLRDGQLKYVLSGIVKPEAILAVVQRQHVPDDWIVSVFDARQARIARSRGHEASVGTGPAPSLRELLASTADEGMGVTSTLEGDRVYAAYVRLRDSGWIVAAGLPTAAFEADLRKAVVVYGGAIALSLLLAALFALLFARRINQPIAELREAARALGRGTVPAAPRTDIVEVHDVGRTLEQAARELARSEGERETLLEAERHARTRLESLALDNSRLYSQAVAAGAQAEAANRAKDQFLAMLGHELRNPLAPIVTAIELMKRRHAGVAERERGIIERQVNHLSRLVDDLLDVSRIAQGKVQLDLRRIDLRHVVEQALEIAAPALGERAPIDVETPDAPVWIDGDEVRLVQVVCNLLANAVKFTSAHGAIGVRVTAAGNDAVVVVRDEGTGITPELLPHVFELFVQGNQALDRHGGGLGLGLGIVKMLAELHGGSVAAESAGVGRGSRFTVRLPRAAGEPAADAPAPEAAAPTPCSGRVLLVDDNVDAALSLGDLLRDAGYEVREVHDGAAALAMLDDFKPDIALLDIGLPGMSGYELAAALRADARMAGLMIIALTGYGCEGDRAQALASEFDEHLVKPVEIADLLGVLGRR